jgi:hypothetical protein
VKNEDYWNNKEARRIELRNSLSWFVFFIIVIIIFEYLWPPLTILSILFIVGGIIIGIYHLYKIQTRIITYPLIRIRDEFLIYDYDQKIILWDNINKINWNPSKTRITIFYKIPAESQSDTLNSPHEKSDYIDVKWIEEKENLIHDLETICEEKEIPFVTNPNENTTKQKDLIQENQ